MGSEIRNIFVAGCKAEQHIAAAYAMLQGIGPVAQSAGIGHPVQDVLIKLADETGRVEIPIESLELGRPRESA